LIVYGGEENPEAIGIARARKNPLFLLSVILVAERMEEGNFEELFVTEPTK